MDKEKTQWFTPGINPAHVGPYEASYFYGIPGVFRFWDGTYWYANADTPDEAVLRFRAKVRETLQGGVYWRGLTTPVYAQPTPAPRSWATVEAASRDTRCATARAILGEGAGSEYQSFYTLADKLPALEQAKPARKPTHREIALEEALRAAAQSLETIWAWRNGDSQQLANFAAVRARHARGALQNVAITPPPAPPPPKTEEKPIAWCHLVRWHSGRDADFCFTSSDMGDVPGWVPVYAPPAAR